MVAHVCIFLNPSRACTPPARLVVVSVRGPARVRRWRSAACHSSPLTSRCACMRAAHCLTHGMPTQLRSDTTQLHKTANSSLPLPNQLRLHATHKLEQRAFGRKHSTLHALLHPGSRDRGDKDKGDKDKDRQGRDQQAKEGGDTATPTTAMGALAAAATGGGGTEAAAADPTAVSTATTTGGTSAAEEQLQQSQITDPGG